MDENKDNSKREKFSGLILPWLNHLYRLFLDPFIKKHNLVLDYEFWIFLSLGIFSFIILKFGINMYVPLGFFLGAFVILLLYNNKYIRRKIFPKQSEQIEDFLKESQKRSLDETLNFLKEYQLNTNQLIKIVEGRFKKYSIVHHFILKYQSAEIEFVEYIIKNKLYEPMGVEYFKKYLFRVHEQLSLSDYKLLKNEFKNNKEMIKILNTCFPSYLKGHTFFKKFTSIITIIKNFFGFGQYKFILFALSALITFYFLSKQPEVLRIQPGLSGAQLLNEIMGNMFAFLVMTTIVFVIFAHIISYLFRFYRFLVYLFAPDD